jgi:hypothetical protein
MSFGYAKYLIMQSNFAYPSQLDYKFKIYLHNIDLAILPNYFFVLNMRTYHNNIEEFALEDTDNLH